MSEPPTAERFAADEPSGPAQLPRRLAQPQIPDEAVEAFERGRRQAESKQRLIEREDWVRAGLAAAYPILAAQVLRDAAVAARSCRTCGRVHQRRQVSPQNALFVQHSWADPDDGHAYRPSGPRHVDDVARWLEHRAEEVFG